MTVDHAHPAVQLCLPGQTHVAEGPHDQSGMYVMHHAFRRDLNDLIAAADRTPVSEARIWSALLDRWLRFAQILHHHHSLEDESLYPVILEHARAAGNTADLATLTAMGTEHAKIAPALVGCERGLTAMTDYAHEGNRETLQRHLTRLGDLLLEHLRHEETEALPVVQRTMTKDEFAASEKAAQRGYPPRMIPFLVPWALAGLPAEARDRILDNTGTPYRVVALLTERRFARRERLAWRYV